MYALSIINNIVTNITCNEWMKIYDSMCSLNITTIMLIKYHLSLSLGLICILI